MDGEFDRKTNDDGWGPVKGPWTSLKVQLDNTLKAIGATCTSKEKDKKLTEAKGKMERLIREKEKSLDDKYSLGKWLWEKVT